MLTLFWKWQFAFSRKTFFLIYTLHTHINFVGAKDNKDLLHYGYQVLFGKQFKIRERKRTRS